jgi:hypothetical protein
MIDEKCRIELCPTLNYLMNLKESIIFSVLLPSIVGKGLIFRLVEKLLHILAVCLYDYIRHSIHCVTVFIIQVLNIYIKWLPSLNMPARNNPTTIAIILITFFKAYPISRPPKNPPPILVDIEVKVSVFIIIILVLNHHKNKQKHALIMYVHNNDLVCFTMMIQ